MSLERDNKTLHRDQGSSYGSCVIHELFINDFLTYFDLSRPKEGKG